MIALSFGPFVVPANLLTLFVAAIVAGLVGRWAGRLHGATIAGVLVDMFLAALIAARLAFVLLWFDRYRPSPWDMLDIRDGGFTAWAGIVSAALVGAWRGWRQPTLRKPLQYGLIAGALVWILSPGAIRFGEGPALISLSSSTLTDFRGAPVNLAAIAKGKPLVINLWATWCPPCRREMPVLVEAQQERPDVGFVFANQGEDGAAVGRYLSLDRAPPANVLLDPSRSIGKAVGSFGLPTTLFYDAQGRLVSTHVGALSAASLAAALADMTPPHLGRAARP